MRVLIGEIAGGVVGPVGLAFENNNKGEWRLLHAIRLARQWAEREFKQAKEQMNTINLEAFVQAEGRAMDMSERATQYSRIGVMLRNDPGFAFRGEEAQIVYGAVMRGIHETPKGDGTIEGGETNVTTDALLGLISYERQLIDF